MKRLEKRIKSCNMDLLTKLYEYQPILFEKILEYFPTPRECCLPNQIRCMASFGFSELIVNCWICDDSYLNKVKEALLEALSSAHCYIKKLELSFYLCDTSRNAFINFVSEILKFATKIELVLCFEDILITRLCECLSLVKPNMKVTVDAMMYPDGNERISGFLDKALASAFCVRKLDATFSQRYSEIDALINACTNLEELTTICPRKGELAPKTYSKLSRYRIAAVDVYPLREIISDSVISTLCTNQCLTRIDFHYCDIREKDLKILTAYLSNSTCLKYLDISGKRISSYYVKEFAEALNKSFSIEEFHVCCSLPDNAEKLLNCFRKCKTLRSMQFRRISFTPVSLNQTRQFDHKRQLESRYSIFPFSSSSKTIGFFLDRDFAGPYFILEIDRFLKGTEVAFTDLISIIRKVMKRGEGDGIFPFLNDHVFEEMITVLEKPELPSLYAYSFSGCKLTQSLSNRVIANCLCHASSLRIFSVKNCVVAQPAVETLAFQLLHHNKTLECIQISGNTFSDVESEIMLCEYMTSCKSLRSVSLEFAKWNPQLASCVINLVTHSPNLEVLVCNYESQDFCEKLLKAIQKNSKIKHLKLGIPPNSKILDYIQYHESLECIANSKRGRAC